MLSALAQAQTGTPNSSPRTLNDPATTDPATAPNRPSVTPGRIGSTPAERRDATPQQTQAQQPMPLPPYVQGEFERFVQRVAGPDEKIRRLGAELITTTADGESRDFSPAVPADYLVATGDEVLVTIWGSVDADLRLSVDRSGQISVPRIGTIHVSGVRYGDLKDLISAKVAQVYKNFQISVSLGQLRGKRVFVTGQVLRPGSYSVTALATVVTALMQAGGPSAAGSFRDIQLRRGSRLVAGFDLYDLLVRGDRSADRLVEAGDVILVGPAALQVGVIGSVNRPAVIELKAGETAADALRYAAGFTAVADRSRLAVERLVDRRVGRIRELSWPTDSGSAMAEGDVLRAFSAVDLALPSGEQNKRVRVEGEVARPAEYILPPGTTIADALSAAGGMTGNAYVYASEFSRESVRLTQQENYDRALRDLESEIARSAASQRVSTADDASGLAARNATSGRLIDRLRALKPSGRVVLQLPTDAKTLPPLLLEDGDRIYVPARPTTVGVFGSVFNAASYLFSPGRSLDDYVRLAGGPTKGADAGSIFVVRANGEVISSRQKSSWFGRGNFSDIKAEPGDTVFVPEELDKTTWVQGAKDWTQILYQFGVGLAGIKAVLP